MRLFIFADLHYIDYDTWQAILNTNKDSFDAIVLLGDIDIMNLAALKNTFEDKPIFGVSGNHDFIGDLDYVNIENIHNKIIELNNVSILGIEGCVRYKNGEKAPLYSQGEIITLCANLSKADIVISHNSPFGIHDSTSTTGDVAHIGFIGLLQYIERHQPKYLLHGHQHIDTVTKYLGTQIIGIYGISILDTNTGMIHKYF